MSTVDYAGNPGRLTWRASIFLLALISQGCRRDPPPPAPLRVAWAGCAAVVRDGDLHCELGEARTLRVVVWGTATVTSIRAGDRAIPPEARSIEIPRGADRVTIDGEVAGRPARFSLRVRDAQRLPWLDEAKALRGKGELAKAKEIAAAHLADPAPAARALARGVLGRILLAEGRADEAFPALREAIELDRRAKRISDAVDDSFALAFALHQRSHRYAEARAVLDAAEAELPDYPEGRARAPYYRGILAAETGDRRSARALLFEAQGAAHDLSMGRLERNARAALALEMQATGLARASLEVLRELSGATDATPCERAEIANDLGWGALLANEAAGSRVQDARGPLELASAVDGCGDAYLRSFALGNLARLALLEGDVHGAARRLDGARAAVKEPRGTDRLSWLDLEGRILLARKRPKEALARFDEERAQARAASLLDHEWSALGGRAEALEALGDKAAAIAALLEAEEKIDRAMLLVPLGGGRGAFVGERSRSARRAVDLLVDAGRVRDAAQVARHSISRVLASTERTLRIERLAPGARARWEQAVHAYRAARARLDEEAAGDWKLPADELARATEKRKEAQRALEAALEQAIAVVATLEPPAEEAPAAGDLELVVHPTAGRWVAMALDRDGATAHEVTDAEGRSVELLGDKLLEPIAARVLAAKRIRVRAYGAWRRVDVHALPVRGWPLVVRAPVDYPVGLRGAHDRAVPPRALVVGDPTGDLPASLEEAKGVARALEGRLGVRTIVRDEATSRGVTEALRDVRLFHYAGHGAFAGADGWGSALPLAGGGQMRVGDVLALAPAPPAVVLSGCEAARDDDDAEGFGLAQAFVVAGADEVIAPVRRVEDSLAAALARALYASQDASLADGLRRAQNELREKLPRADWASFRVVSR